MGGERAPGHEPEHLTVEQAAERSGVPVERIRRILLSAGLSLDRAGASDLTEEDLPAIELFALSASLVGEDAALGFARLLGQTAARVAEGSVEVFASEIAGLLDAADEGDSKGEIDHGVAALAAIEATKLVPDAFGRLLHHHLHRSVRRSLMERLDEDPDRVRISVGFIDLVGSTAWARGASLADTAVALEGFEAAAFDIVTKHGGWVVKLVGDAVMFAVTNPVDACQIALGICAAVDADPLLPQARGGVATGIVQARDGDYFGTVVNLAARAEARAAPSTVAVSEAVAERLAQSDEAAGWCIEELPPKALRGFDEPPRLWGLSLMSELP